jgi:hypothetical protein
VGGVRHTTGLHDQLLLDANLAAEEVDVTKLQAEDLSPTMSTWPDGAWVSTASTSRCRSWCTA